MMRSLVLKLGLLALTVGLVFWIGWQVPDPVSHDAAGPDHSGSAEARVSIEPQGAQGGTDRFEKAAAAAGAGAVQDIGNAGRPVTHSRLDLNRADAKALESLPGIGAVLAQRVIEYRTAVGRFQAIDDLRAVKGIGPKIFERIRPLVMIAAADTTDKAEKRPL
jgi:competence protein ComEA